MSLITNTNISSTTSQSRLNLKTLKAIGFKNADEATIKKSDVDKSVGKFELLSDVGHLSDKERAKVFDRFGYALSGYTRGTGEAKVSIWGKLIGYDNDFSKGQIKELKGFIDDSKMLGRTLMEVSLRGKKRLLVLMSFMRDISRLALLVL